jgi:hypothetical protein
MQQPQLLIDTTVCFSHYVSLTKGIWLRLWSLFRAYSGDTQAGEKKKKKTKTKKKKTKKKEADGKTSEIEKKRIKNILLVMLREGNR